MRWLVISDIHSTISNFKTEESKRKIYQRLKNEAAKCSFDFILIIGDCMNQHMGSEKSVEFIEKIRESCGNNVKIYMCAGNHDILRSDKDTSRCDMIQKARKSRIIPESIFYREAYSDFQDMYSRITQEKVYEPYKIYEENDYRVIRIDTCLFSMDNDDCGNLFVLNREIKKISEINNEKLNIVIMHHGVSFLDEREQNAFQHWLADHNIDIVFSGHSHIPSVNILSEAIRNDENIREYVCGAMHKESDGKRDEQKVSFYICDYDINECRIKTYVYKYSENDDWNINDDEFRQFKSGVSNYDLIWKKNLRKNTSIYNPFSCKFIYNRVADIDFKKELHETGFFYYFGIKGDKVFSGYENLRDAINLNPGVEFKFLITNPYSPYWLERVPKLKEYDTPYKQETHFADIYNTESILFEYCKDAGETAEVRFHNEPIRWRMYFFEKKMFFSLYSDKHSLDAKMYEFDSNSRFYKVYRELFFDYWKKYEKSKQFPKTPKEYNFLKHEFCITPTLVINVTDDCNLSCNYCPNGGENLKNIPNSEFVSIDKIKMLMKCYLQHIGVHISPLGAPTLRITGGEPLIKADVVKILLETVIELNRSNNINNTKFEKIVLDTNGILLYHFFNENRGLLSRLKEILLFKISLDSLDINVLKRMLIRPRQISADKLKSIKNTIQILSTNGFKVEINTVLSIENVNGIPSIYEYAKTKGIIGVKILSKNSFGGIVSINDSDNQAVEINKKYMDELISTGQYIHEFPYLNYDSGARMERLTDKVTGCKLTFVNHNYKSSPRTYSNFCRNCNYIHKCSTGIMSLTMRVDGEISFCRHASLTKNIKCMDELEIDRAVDGLMDAYIRCYHYFEEL